MGEPILRIKSAPLSITGFMAVLFIIVLFWVLFDVMTFMLIPRTLLSMMLSQVTWLIIIFILQLFFLVIFVGSLRRTMKLIKWRRSLITELTIYDDYVSFLTYDGDEHKMSVEDFNPCIIEYIPPTQSSPSPPPPIPPPPPPTFMPPTYGPPGGFVIRINYGVKEYFLFIMTYQYPPEINNALRRIKKPLDWCGDS